MIAIQRTNVIAPSPSISDIKNYHNYNILNSMDSISFKGLHVERAQSYKEIKELTDLFYEALKHNVEPNSKIPGFIDMIRRNILTLPFILTAKQPTVITEVVKSGNKLVGGYSLDIIENKTSYLQFITLAPDVIKTKTGIETLKLMGQRICNALESNDVEEMTWTAAAKNTSINNLLKRLKTAKKKQCAFSNIEYTISLEDFKKNLTNL